MEWRVSPGPLKVGRRSLSFVMGHNFSSSLGVAFLVIRI